MPDQKIKIATETGTKVAASTKVTVGVMIIAGIMTAVVFVISLLNI
jgi:hypothetical protein